LSGDRRVRRHEDRVTHFPARTTVPCCNFLPKPKAKFEFRKFFLDLPAQAIFISLSRAFAPSGKHPKPIALSPYEKHPSAFRSHQLQDFAMPDEHHLSNHRSFNLGGLFHFKAIGIAADRAAFGH
jgi:hypothetical protein